MTANTLTHPVVATALREEGRSRLIRRPVDTPAALTWQWHAPRCEAAGQASALPGRECLAEISEMRGRVLYANGRRPVFRQPDDRFADPDPLDPLAFHMTARAGHRLVGCIRTVPLGGGALSVCETLLGSRPIEALLAGWSIARPSCCETGRWVVCPEYEGSRVAPRLYAAILALARHLGFRFSIGMVGTRDGQDRILGRLGARPVPGFDLLRSDALDDDLRFMYVDLADPHGTPHALMARMAAQLGLGDHAVR